MNDGGERQFAATVPRRIGTVRAGHTAMAPVVSPDGRTLYVCNRFENTVSFIDLGSLRETHRVPVVREPVAAAVSPDGHWACVTHLLARFQNPARQVERGWMNANALSFIDLVELRHAGMVLLDDKERGAANPWAVLWSPDGRQIFVTHAGTHEVSVIDAPGLLARLAGKNAGVTREPAYDHSFLDGLRHRIKLPGRGPRALALAGQKVVTADYFSDTLSAIDLSEPEPAVSMVRLDASTSRNGGDRSNSAFRLPVSVPLDAVTPTHEDPGGRQGSRPRDGEARFNDATWCFQGWQSCASCHSSDGRTDGLNWDLLNDGVANPKNSKSLLLAFQTPPAMSQGVRSGPGEAVRAGFRHVPSL